MKRIFYFAIAAISIVSVDSCSVKELDYITEETSSEQQEIVIEASLADTDFTKTIRKEDGKIYWNPADEINVFYGTDKGKFTSTNTQDELTAKFSGSLLITSVVGMNEGGDDSNCLWGLYPYDENATLSDGEILTSLSENQIGVAGTFPDDTYITLAKDKSFSLAFYNVLSGFRFTVTKSGISSITFRGNNNEVLAGSLNLAFGDNGRPIVKSITNGATELALIPESGEFEAGKDYYILMVPTTFNKGFTVKMTTTDNEEGIFEYTKSITFERNIFTRKTNMDSSIEFKKPTPEAVDLGLGVNWASFNVGAASPDGLGDLYAWGETSPKSNYSWANYKFGNYEYSGSLNKYWDKSGKSYDGKRRLDAEDDVASIQYGEYWRTPSPHDWVELITNTSWTWTSVNGISGYRLTSTVDGYNDKSIFLPADYFEDSNYYFSGYWTNEISESLEPWKAYSFWIKDTPSWQEKCQHRNYGYYVRAVEDLSSAISGIELNKTSITMSMAGTESLTAKVITSEDRVCKDVIWSTSNSKVATVSQDGCITAHCAGNAVITAKTKIGEKSATCRVLVEQAYVDLGLPSGTLWATCNLGASSHEEKGDCFAWGEVSPRDENFFTYENMAKYLFYYSYSNSKMKVTKYCSSSDYGAVDNLITLLPQDDAASVLLGDGWRMPVESECLELIEKCTWIEDSAQWGAAGWFVKGPNGNSIYILATGADEESDFAELWSSSLAKDYRSDYAKLLYIDTWVGRYTCSVPRWSGYYIRPVKQQ